MYFETNIVIFTDLETLSLGMDTDVFQAAFVLIC